MSKGFRIRLADTCLGAITPCGVSERTSGGGPAGRSRSMDCSGPVTKRTNIQMTLWDTICDKCGVKIIGYTEEPIETRCVYCMGRRGEIVPLRILCRELPDGRCIVAANKEPSAD